jgi:hypothetical protein
MAKIVLSDAAPSESIHFSFSAVEFDLKGKQTYKTDDLEVITNATVHPWLDVTPDEGLTSEPQYVDQIDPKDDPLSAVNQQANDPKAIKAADEKAAEAANPVAIDAGLNQTKSVTTGDVAETLAADPTSKTTDKD